MPKAKPGQRRALANLDKDDVLRAEAAGPSPQATRFDWQASNSPSLRVYGSTTVSVTCWLSSRIAGLFFHRHRRRAFGARRRTSTTSGWRDGMPLPVRRHGGAARLQPLQVVVGE